MPHSRLVRAQTRNQPRFICDAAYTPDNGKTRRVAPARRLARRGSQTLSNGQHRKRGKRYPIWELQWWADYLTPDGKIGRKRESEILGYTADLTLKQARKLAAEKLLPLNQGKLTPMATVTFGDFIERIFVPNALPSLKQSTRKRYRSTLNFHLLPAFGQKRLCDISTLDLQSFIISKMEQGSGWEVCNHLRNLMSNVFDRAKKWGHYAGDNPASGVELPEKIPVHEKRALTAEQCQRLLAELDEPVRTMVQTGILTGLRVGEILGLRWEDVDLPNRLLHVRQSVYRGSVGTPKTKGSKRSLPVPEPLALALERHAQGKPVENRLDNRLQKPVENRLHTPVQNRLQKPVENRLVFPTATGTPYSDSNLLARHIKPAGNRIGAPWIGWHTLRRTHATLLSVSGASPKDAQAQLGHAHISTTMDIYTQPMPEHQREAVAKMAELVTNGDEFASWPELAQQQTTQIQ